MFVYPLILTFSLLGSLMVDTESNCKFKKNADEVFELKFGKAKTTIDVFGPDAKLEKCSLWKGFPDLLVVEVFLGTTGTRSEVQSTDLMIFKRQKRDLHKILRKTLRETSVVFKTDLKGPQIEKISRNYELTKTPAGAPALRWKENGQLEEVRLNH